jgi:hypothetical protein
MKRTQILIVLLLFIIVDAFGQRIINFSGVVKDSQTGNPLEGINIFITEKNTGTISDNTGEFFVFLAGGIYNVSITADGYKTQKFLIDLSEDKFSEILLAPSSEMRKKNYTLAKRKSHSPEEVMIEKTKSKTIKNS